MEENKSNLEEIIEKGIDPDLYHQLSTTLTRNRLSIMLAALGAGLILFIFTIAILKTDDAQVIESITDKALIVVSAYVGATLPTIITSLFENQTKSKTE